MVDRRRSFDPQAARDQALYDLLRAKKLLDSEDPTGAGFAPTAFEEGAADFTFRVAVNGSSRPAVVASADFVAGSSAADVQINAALDSCLDVPAGYGRVLLAEGVYELTAGGSITIHDNCSLIGAGKGATILRADVQSSDFSFIYGDRTVLAHFAFETYSGGS